MIRFIELPILSFDESVAVVNASNIPTNIPEIDDTVVKKHVILTEEMCQNVVMVVASYPVTAKSRQTHYEDVCEIIFHNSYPTNVVVKSISNIPLKARDVMNLINSKLKEWEEDDIRQMEADIEEQIIFHEELERAQRNSERKAKKKKPLELPSPNPSKPNPPIIN